MGVSVKVDYDEIPIESKSIRGYAKEINSNLIEVYKEVADMHAHWYGKRYNELVEKFNNLVPQLNQFLELIVGEVPCMYEKIANNFSEVDINQNVTTSQEEPVIKLTVNPIINDVGMRYIEEEVTVAEKSIVSILHDTIDTMEIINRTVSQMELVCDGAEKFNSQFSKLTDTFKQVLNNIETQFSMLMEQDRNLMKEAEKDSTVE